MKRILQHLGMLASTITLLLAPATKVAAAGAPNLYFSKATDSVEISNNVSVPIRLNANGTPVNTVKVVVNFPSDKFEFVSLDKSGSYFDTFIPQPPESNPGKVEFSVASMAAGPTSGDVLVGILVLNAKVNSGSAQLTLSESASANNGNLIDVTTNTSTINFTTQQTPPSAVEITNVRVTDLTVNGGTVRWHTNVPSSSSVDYGLSTNYGSSASASGLVTEHAVKLPSKFAAKTLVHYRVTSVAADSSSKTSGDNTFTTSGYTVVVTVKDKKGKPVSGAKVQVLGGASVTTNGNGEAAIPDLSPGSQKFTVDGGEEQLVTVTEPDAGSTEPQHVTLSGSSKSNIILYGAAAALLIGGGVAIYLVIKRGGHFGGGHGPIAASA